MISAVIEITSIIRLLMIDEVFLLLNQIEPLRTL